MTARARAKSRQWPRPRRWSQRTAQELASCLRAFVDFEREVSVVAARGVDGSFSHWGVIDNTHRNHILDPQRLRPPTFRPLVRRCGRNLPGILEKLERGWRPLR